MPASPPGGRSVELNSSLGEILLAHPQVKCTAKVTGWRIVPAFVLTAAETLLIRTEAVPGPPRTAHRAAAPRPHRPEGGDPRC